MAKRNPKSGKGSKRGSTTAGSRALATRRTSSKPSSAVPSSPSPASSPSPNTPGNRTRASSASRQNPPARRPVPLPSARQGRRTNKPPRYKPPPRYLTEIHRLQKSVNLLIPAATFGRLVKQVTVDVTGCNELRYKALAIKALHEAAEAYIIGILEDSYLVTLHSNRVTLMAKDLRLAYRIRGDADRLGA